jgi:hypothetical protein
MEPVAAVPSKFIPIARANPSAVSTEARCEADPVEAAFGVVLSGVWPVAPGTAPPDEDALLDNVAMNASMDEMMPPISSASAYCSFGRASFLAWRQLRIAISFAKFERNGELPASVPPKAYGL